VTGVLVVLAWFMGAGMTRMRTVRVTGFFRMTAVIV
jgi:hypothetical protein